MIEKALAATGVDPLELGKNIPDQNLGTLFGRFLFWLLVIAAVASFASIIINGVKLITSGGDPSALATARTSLLWSIIGVIVIGSSLLIVTFVFNFVASL